MLRCLFLFFTCKDMNVSRKILDENWRAVFLRKVWQEAEEEPKVRGREREVKEAVENWS